MVRLQQNGYRRIFSPTHTHTHTHWALNSGELSASMLCFLSVSLMRRRLFSLYVCDFSWRNGWKKLDIDVRPTFHLEAGYPLSKHRTQLTNESNRQAQRSTAVFKGVMMYKGPTHTSATTRRYLPLLLCSFIL